MRLKDERFGSVWIQCVRFFVPSRHYTSLAFGLSNKKGHRQTGDHAIAQRKNLILFP